MLCGENAGWQRKSVSHLNAARSHLSFRPWRCALSQQGILRAATDIVAPRTRVLVVALAGWRCAWWDAALIPACNLHVPNGAAALRMDYPLPTQILYQKDDAHVTITLIQNEIRILHSAVQY